MVCEIDWMEMQKNGKSPNDTNVIDLDHHSMHIL
jgi:hypothetical protein